MRRSCVVRHGGAVRKENVGISNVKYSEKLYRRKTKVSWIYVNQNRVSRGLRRSREVKSMENRLIFLYLCILRRRDGGA